MKKILLLIVVLLCTAAAAIYYCYDRISYQPDWYAGSQTSRKYLPTHNSNDLERKIIADLKKGKKVEIPAESIVPLITARLEKKTGFNIQKALKAVRTTLKSDAVEMEMVVDVRQVRPEKLPADARKVLDQVLKVVPENALKNLYVKSNMQFVKQKDFVSLNPVSGISIGKINLPIEELKKKLGSKAKISLKEFPISNFELKENSVVFQPKLKMKGAR